MSPVVVRAAAKINLHLGVGRPRPDGFHPLITVYQAVGLCDDVTATTSDDWRLDLALPDWVEPGSVPTDGSNLVDRAASLLASHHRVTLKGRLHVAKAIPVAGGLAGGSADAAAALVAFDRLWDLGTTDDDLLRLAATLGSDVPFALVGGTALGTGRGEVVEAVGDPGTWWWVLVPDPVGLSTPAVYAHFDELFPDASPTPRDADALLAALRSGEPVSLARALHNDLQEPALDLRPELGDLLEAGEAAGALRGIVSGSGPTCVFLCESAEHAREVAGSLQHGGRRVLVAPGPVAGAHVVHAHG
jgi:4-diphosphocytidyl-2-C-methyl-D-erythritol kinase